MKFYFIRHGETDNARDKIFGPDADHLNDAGIHQARLLAEHLAKEAPFDALITSPISRAEETATIVGRAIGRAPVAHDIFREKKIASSFLNKPFYEESIQKIRTTIREHNRTEPLWHYEDEENFLDIRARAEKAIAYLIALNKEKIAIVTHSTFIKALALTLMFEEHLTFDIYYRFLLSTNIKTGGLVVFEHREPAHWHLIEWNDYRHLS